MTIAPLITTIIPTYRRPLLLRRAILSALNQTYPHVQVCVYDNASGDETEAVVQEIAQRDPRVKYHRHHQNIGSYNNFNYGIRNVDTPFFSLLSDDDILAPGFYEQAVPAFERYPDAMFVCMPAIAIDTALHVISGPIPVDSVRYYRQGEAVKGIMEGTIPGTWTGILFRREVRDEIGLIDTSVGPHADGGFVYHAAARYAGVAVPGVAAVLMAHEESVSGTSVPVSGEWVKWWDTMMRAIYEDDKVPYPVKKYIREFPSPDYLGIGVKQVGHALVKGNYGYAYRAALGVKECGHPFASMILGALIWCCEHLHADHLAKAVKTIRDLLLRRRRRVLHERYGHLVEFVRRYMRDGANPASPDGRVHAALREPNRRDAAE